jgi:hypothetical protein
VTSSSIRRWRDAEPDQFDAAILAAAEQGREQVRTGTAQVHDYVVARTGLAGTRSEHSPEILDEKGVAPATLGTNRSIATPPGADRSAALSDTRK